MNKEKDMPLKEYRPGKKRVKKSSVIIWTPECDIAFNKIKQMLKSPPVLNLPTKHGKFIVYCDTSKLAVGSSIFQQQFGQERLIAYYSRRLPNACQRYSSTELEMFGLSLVLKAFRYLLNNVHFEVRLDHSALVNIWKSRTQPPSNRISKLIERLQDYSFQITYIKGKTMYISDMLSRYSDMSADPLDDNAVGFISNTPEYNDTISMEEFITMEHDKTEENFIEHSMLAFPATESNRRVTRSMAKANKIKLETGLESSRRKRKELRRSTRQTKKTNTNVSTGHADSNTDHRDTNTGMGDTNTDHGTTHVEEVERNADIGESGATQHRESRIPERNTQSTLVNPNFKPAERKEIQDSVPRLQQNIHTDDVHEGVPSHHLKSSAPIIIKLDKDSILRKHLPKQKEIDAILKLIEKKVLNDYSLPITKVELRDQQKADPIYKRVYEYIQKSYLPANKKAARKIMTMAENYILCDDLLFKLVTKKDDNEDLKLSLVIPDKLVDRVLERYHTNLLSSHIGITRTYYTIRKLFHIDRLHDRLTKYITSCRICQARKDPVAASYPRELELRIPDNFSPFSEVSVDLKSMPISSEGHKYIMLVRCSITKYLVGCALKDRTATTIAEALLQKVICQFGIFQRLITDKDSCFANQVVALLCDALNIEQKFISVNNHGSLQVERSIQTVSNLLISHLEGSGSLWHLYLQPTLFAQNTFIMGNTEYSAYYLLYLRNPPDLTKFSTCNTQQVSTTYKSYAELLKARLEKVSSIVLSKQAELQKAQYHQKNLPHNKSKTFYPGQLVYLLAPDSTSLPPSATKSKKIILKWLGPITVRERLSNHLYLLQTIQGEILQNTYHISRLKTAFVRSPNGKISETMEDLRQNSILENKDHIQSPLKSQPSDKEALFTMPGVSTNTNLHIGATCQAYVTLSDSPQTSLFKIQKVRHKNGLIELSCVKDDDPKVSFWIQPHLYPAFDEQLQSVHDDFWKGIKTSGSKGKFERRISNILLNIDKQDHH